MLGVFSLVVSRRLDPFFIRRTDLIAAAAYLAIPFILIAISGYMAFEAGYLSMTYGNIGLEQAYRTAIPTYFALVFLATILGPELLFRVFCCRCFEDSKYPLLLANAFQAAVYILWLAPALRPLLNWTEFPEVGYFFLSQYLAAFIAGVLYLRTRCVFVSGVWSAVFIFLPFYVLTDIDLGLDTYGHYTTSTNDFYIVSLAGLAAAALLLSLLLLRHDRGSK